MIATKKPISTLVLIASSLILMISFVIRATYGVFQISIAKT